MKIKEVEELIITNGFSEELFEEFKFSLRRVPAVLRCQHCYLTADKLRVAKTDEIQKKKNFEGAIRMMEYGIENHTENDYYMRAAHQYMGEAYREAGNFEKAKFYLQKTSTIEYGPKMISYYAYRLARVELYANHFRYTPYLEELYEQMSSEDDDLFANLRRSIFYRSLVEIIIAKKNKDRRAKKIACENAMNALRGKTMSETDRILQRHKIAFALTLDPTDEALAFLKRNLLWPF